MFGFAHIHLTLFTAPPFAKKVIYASGTAGVLRASGTAMKNIDYNNPLTSPLVGSIALTPLLSRDLSEISVSETTIDIHYAMEVLPFPRRAYNAQTVFNRWLGIAV